MAEIGSFFAKVVYELVGQWSSSLNTLCYFIIIDILLGLFTATITKTSTKSKSGKLCSRALFKGICKKVGVLLVVMIAYRIDIEIKQVVPSFSSIKVFTVWFFILDECLSIIENLSLLGVPIPGKIQDVLDILHDRLDESSKADNYKLKVLEVEDLEKGSDSQENSNSGGDKDEKTCR